MADTSYIEQILLGTALQGVPHKPPRQKKPSWTSETAGGQTQHRRGNSKASSQHPSTSAGPSTAPPAEPLSRPSSRSTPKLFHCEACDVWLPCKPLSNWDVHVAGIRHRRQLLSLREHGRRDRLVLSVFESDPAQQSSGTRDPASRLAAGSESVAESSSFPWAKEVLTALKAQFLGLHGHGRQYDSVFRRLFTPKNLHLGYLDLQNLLAGAPRGAGYESTVVLTDLAAFKDEQREASVLGVAADNLGRMTWPAGVASE